MTTLLDMDSPWHRLRWTLPTALLIWAVALWGLSYFIEKPTHRPVELLPINAQLIEEPVPAATQSIQPAPPAPVHKAKPLPTPTPQQAPATPEVIPHTEQNPAAQEAKETPNSGAQAGGNIDVLTSAGSGGTGSLPRGTTGSGGTGGLLRDTAGPVGTGHGKGSSGGNMYASSGARAIIRPMPQIPDDLREGAFSFAALARFHVAADGSVVVELVKPTPNPRLNGILLDSLKKWRFIPAIKNGKPVASIEEIVVKIEVK